MTAQQDGWIDRVSILFGKAFSPDTRRQWAQIMAERFPSVPVDVVLDVLMQKSEELEDCKPSLGQVIRWVAEHTGLRTGPGSLDTLPFCQWCEVGSGKGWLIVERSDRRGTICIPCTCPRGRGVLNMLNLSIRSQDALVQRAKVEVEKRRSEWIAQKDLPKVPIGDTFREMMKVVDKFIAEMPKRSR